MLGRWAVLLVVVSLAGCAREQQPEPIESAAPQVSAEPPALEGPPKPWDAMTFEEHTQYMTERVLPIMQAKFQAFDGQRFAAFGCHTCHGTDMEAKRYVMPNPSLTLLPAPRTPEWEAMRGATTGMAAFMWKDVWPSMITLLGSTPLNPATREGFGCTGCHLHAPPPGETP